MVGFTWAVTRPGAPDLGPPAGPCRARFAWIRRPSSDDSLRSPDPSVGSERSVSPMPSLSSGVSPPLCARRRPAPTRRLPPASPCVGRRSGSAGSCGRPSGSDPSSDSSSGCCRRPMLSGSSLQPAACRSRSLPVMFRPRRRLCAWANWIDDGSLLAEALGLHLSLPAGQPRVLTCSSWEGSRLRSSPLLRISLSRHSCVWGGGGTHTECAGAHQQRHWIHLSKVSRRCVSSRMER